MITKMNTRNMLSICLCVLALLLTNNSKIFGQTPVPVHPNPEKWKLVISDEFNGPTLDTTKWISGWPWGPCAHGMEYNAPENLSFTSDGILVIKADKGKRGAGEGGCGSGGRDYTSGMIQGTKIPFKYGYIEARTKVPKGRGFDAAFFLASSDPNEWPPEIDIHEILGRDTTKPTINVHFRDGSNKQTYLQSEFSSVDLSEQFGVWGLEWNENEIIWYLDGVEKRRETRGVPHQLMRIILNLHIGLDPNWTQYPDATTPFPSYMYVDYVRVYQLKEAAPLTAPAVTVHPLSQSKFQDESMSFNIQVIGSEPYSFQWRKNGVNIPGATGRAYTISKLTESDHDAEITCVVKNSIGEAVSQPAKVSVYKFKDFPAKYTTTVPTIDGNIDDAWAKAKVYEIKNIVLGSATTPADVSGKFRTMWDGDYLYVLTEVKDDVKKQTPVSPAYNNDGVEIYLDADNNRSNSDSAKDFQWFLTYNNPTASELRGKTAGITFAQKDTADGYIMEAKIHWASIGVNPEQNMPMGFDVSIDDDDKGTGRESQATWWAPTGNAWQDHTLLGVIALAEPDEATAAKIISHPISQQKLEGESVSFKVGAIGVSPISYQWKRNGVDIPGATSATYTISSVKAEDNGAEYSVLAKNALGESLSKEATLKVRPLTDFGIWITSSAPTIDGDVDEIWNNQVIYPIKNNSLGVTSDADLSGQWRAMWDSTYLYILVEVTDDIKTEPTGPPYEDDAVELLLDTDNHKASAWYNEDFLFQLVYNRPGVTEAKRGNVTGVTHAQKDTAKGYNMEVRIPWTLLRATPSNRKLMGFDINIDDDDDGNNKENLKSWWSKTPHAWNDHTQLGTVALFNTGQPPIGPKNLIINPSFETDNAIVDRPNGWKTWEVNGNVQADGLWQYFAHTGNFCGYHWFNAPYQVWTYQRMTGLENGRYRLSAWVINGGGQNAAQMGAVLDGGNTWTYVDLPKGEEWQKISMDIEVTNGECEVGFWSDARANKWLGFDSVELIKLEQ